MNNQTIYSINNDYIISDGPEPEIFCTCPHCGDKLTEEEYEAVRDCGCPMCRKYFEIEETEDLLTKAIGAEDLFENLNNIFKPVKL
jgi:Zn finger protein HypA/HybF involved in hydrogenase expression